MYSHYCCLLLLLAGSLSLCAQSQDLTIIKQDWTTTQAAAQEQDKLILIDFYTTWCGPCKVFDRYVEEHESFAQAIGSQYVMLK
ncbi:MAG: thioredoxin family protein, partial [Bacteroidota bacterium]